MAPFLDRLSQNHLCSSNKELYEKRFRLEPRWPYRNDYLVDSCASSLAFSNDGKFLAIGDANDGTIVVMTAKEQVFTDNVKILGFAVYLLLRITDSLRQYAGMEGHYDCGILRNLIRSA